MRAFRPSRFGSPEEVVVDPADAIERIVKMRAYARRARAHQPLFQDKVESQTEQAQKQD